MGPDLETVADLVPTKLLILERGKNEVKRGILNVTIVFLVEKQQISPLEKKIYRCVWPLDEDKELFRQIRYFDAIFSSKYERF